MPGQGVVVQNIGTYVALIESQQQALKNRLDVLVPEGNLLSISPKLINWTEMSPSVSGFKYRASAAGTALANSTTETSLVGSSASGSLVFAANTLRAGSVLRFSAAMGLGATATPTLALKLKLNGVAIVTTTLAPITTSNGVLDIEIVIMSSTSGMYKSTGIVNGIASVVVCGTSVGTLDLTSTNTFDLTGTWSAASASNTVTLNYLTLTHAL